MRAPAELRRDGVLATQIYQAWLKLQAAHAGAVLSQPKHVLLVAAEVGVRRGPVPGSQGCSQADHAWLLQAWQVTSMATQTSAMQRLVREALQDLGLEPELEHRMAAPSFSIDLALPQHKVAIEVRLRQLAAGLHLRAG